jgi:hypothetical protein
MDQPVLKIFSFQQCDPIGKSFAIRVIFFWRFSSKDRTIFGRNKK